MDGERLVWQLPDADMVTVPGAGGLPTLRLTCSFTADADLAAPADLEVSDGYLADRVGWREMTVLGDGVGAAGGLPGPHARAAPTSCGTYPVDLLASPLDVRGFTVRPDPGHGDADRRLRRAVGAGTRDPHAGRAWTAGSRTWPATAS